MNWGELSRIIDENIKIGELRDDATVYIKGIDEYFKIESFGRCTDGVLDDNHFHLIVDNGPLYGEDNWILT